jgi:hypothetical protein
MARFYLHLCNGDGWTRDGEGMEFRGPAEAAAAALRDVRHLIAADVMDGRPVTMSSFIAIHDESGREVHRVLYADSARFV